MVSGVFAVVSLITVWVAAAPPAKITSEVALTVDITAEVHSLLTFIESSLASGELYNERRDQVRRQAIQVAILAQASADHDALSIWKESAPELRDAALVLARSKSLPLEEAAMSLEKAKEAIAGKLSGRPAAEADWGKLASTGTLMSIMKERTELIRKGLRKPKDPAVESRNAMVVSIMALALHNTTHALKDPAEKPAWQEICMELQVHMSRAADAVRSKDPGSAADHFRMGMEACDKCHQKFKP